MRVLGLMSGTSADGIDVALVRIAGAPPKLRARLENFSTIPYPPAVRARVLHLANDQTTSTAEISQLNSLLGELFARAALAACRRFGLRVEQIDLIGSHGQTIFHQGRPELFLGPRPVASTLQIGEPAVIAERTGVPVVADFRTADIAAGGQGAPLVPFVDYLLYRHERFARVALNIGGIANVTLIPRAARPRQVFAFDTGPGNMVADGLLSYFTRGRLRYDRHAAMARSGRLLPDLLDELLSDPYFRRPPPKTAGREQFGAAFVHRILAWQRQRRARPRDIVHTATLLTPLSILNALRRWVRPALRRAPAQLIVSGGGVHNPLVMAQLAAGLEAAMGRSAQIVFSGELGMPEDAKEAFAFAILAYETWHGRPANLPRATGARHAAILGKICLPTKTGRRK